MNNQVAMFFLLMALSGMSWAHQDDPVIEVDLLAKTSSSWNGAPLPNCTPGETEVTILKVSVPPKAEVAMHKHPLINAGVLLKGQLTVVTEKGKTLQLKAGDPIVEVVNTWHYGVNDGDETAEIIVFYVGPKGTPLSVKRRETIHSALE